VLALGVVPLQMGVNAEQVQLALDAAVAVDAMVIAFKEGSLVRAYVSSTALEGTEESPEASLVLADAVVAASIRLESEENVAKNQSDPLRLAMTEITKLVSLKRGVAVSDKLRHALSLALIEVG